MSASNYRQILGIRFFTGSAEEAIAIGMRGGLVVVPSAPVLQGMLHDPFNRDAVICSDLAIPDSGLMVLVWNLVMRDRIPRISGLKYLKLLLDQPALRVPGALFWVMPSDESMVRFLGWLKDLGFPTTADDCYVAPQYGAGAAEDEALVRILNARRPSHVIISIGGGVQEKLGYYLKRNLAFIPAIHCTGAAAGFLSGDQVNIPPWADRFFLGWGFRCLSAPAKYIPRYWKARILVWLVLRFRERWPAESEVFHDARCVVSGGAKVRSPGFSRKARRSAKPAGPAAEPHDL